MNSNRKSALGTTLLVLALLAAPAASALSGPDCFVATAPAPAKAAGCCGDAPDSSPGSDCCSEDIPGCPLPCCNGLTSTAAKSVLNQEPGEATPTRFVVAQDRVPLVFPRPIDHPPRT
jgi:hypothetical protein